MPLKYLGLFISVCFIFFSCSKMEQFPQKKSEKIPAENLTTYTDLISGKNQLAIDSTMNGSLNNSIEKLAEQKKWYDEKNTGFNLSQLEVFWEDNKNEISKTGFEGLTKWVEVTGFLFELTEKTKYAGELERIVYRNDFSCSAGELTRIENQILPYVFTKNTDHIHINLFTNAGVQFVHSLGGAVKITQETNYPVSGKLLVKFEMEEKRFIELFVRIPEWADGTTVTEKGVRYVAQPGSYCQITRKWTTGDVVEIVFPENKIPEYLKPDN